LSIVLDWSFAIIFNFLFIMRKPCMTRLEWSFLDIDFFKILYEISLFFDFIWQVIVRCVVLSKWNLLISTLSKAISSCRWSKITTNLVNLPKSHIFRVLNFHLISWVFSWSNLVKFILLLKHSFCIGTKFLYLISFQFFLYFNIFTIVPWSRIFIFLVNFQKLWLSCTVR
jgi:hypothetical protein